MPIARLLLPLAFLCPALLSAQDVPLQSFEVDSVAAPRGGTAMLDTYLHTNLQKPFMARVANAKGRITLQGIVETDGRISDVKLVRGLRPDCDAEALRVFRLFNAWKPALKEGKPVRQVITYPVVFRANMPVFYENGTRTTYYNDTDPSEVDDPTKATMMTAVPIDTLTGLPNGDLTIYKVAEGKRGRRVDRYPLIRKELRSEETDAPPTIMLGHKQATSDWVGLIYRLRVGGTLLNIRPSDHQTGHTITFANNGMVESIRDNETSSYTEWYANGQIKKITQRERDTSKATRTFGPEKLIYEWDEAGTPMVVNGTGKPTYHGEIASKRDPARKTRLTTEGSYRNGVQHGLWRAYAADSSYSYEEQYEDGKSLGGTAISNGVATHYDKAETAPEFIGGQKAMYQFLGSTIRYPADAQRARAMGKVFVSFTVCTDGSLCDFDVLKGVYPSIDDEALRVVLRMTKHWKPGLLRGEPVRVRYNLPISFQLE
jgi:TonB family protein